MVFSLWSAHEQIITTDIIAIIRRPAPIPNIRTRLGRFPLWEILGGLDPELCCAGAFVGDEPASGAVYQMQASSILMQY